MASGFFQGASAALPQGAGIGARMYEDAMKEKTAAENKKQAQSNFEREFTLKEKALGLKGKAAADKAAVPDAKADDYITNIGRELTAQSNVYKLGKDKKLFEPSFANQAAHAAMHSGIGSNPLTQGLVRNSLPEGAMQFNADNENAGLALAKVVGGGRPNEFVQKTLQSHRAIIGGGEQQAREAYDASIDAARAEAEGQLAKIYAGNPAKAAEKKMQLEQMFGDFKQGGRMHPFASATYKTGLQTIPAGGAAPVAAPAGGGWKIE